MLYTPRSTLYALRSTLYALRSTLYTVRCTLYTVQSTFYALLSTLYALRYSLLSALSKMYNLPSKPIQGMGMQTSIVFSLSFLRFQGFRDANTLEQFQI